MAPVVRSRPYRSHPDTTTRSREASTLPGSGMAPKMPPGPAAGRVRVQSVVPSLGRSATTRRFVRVKMTASSPAYGNCRLALTTSTRQAIRGSPLFASTRPHPMAAAAKAARAQSRARGGVIRRRSGAAGRRRFDVGPPPWKVDINVRAPDRSAPWDETVGRASDPSGSHDPAERTNHLRPTRVEAIPVPEDAIPHVRTGLGKADLMAGSIAYRAPARES
jgi:hypothetical protein